MGICTLWPYPRFVEDENDYLEYVQGSSELGFRDIRPGDVFLFLEFNDDVVNTLNNSGNGERFLVAWNTAGFLLNGQNAFEKIKDRDLPLFIVMKFSWDGLTALEKSLFNESELARIEELLEVINSTLNY